ncbi:MAG: hypothetical protein K9M94_10840 [Spirochaetia bacterium]|nr:hypothetical protein [Spirochaetia bacterium]
MSILKYKTQLRRALTGIVTLALLSLLSIGCNQDGVGIFYSISQEKEQITSKISEVSVYQVVDAGSYTYALGGRTVWQQSGNNWNNLGGGYAYNIVADSGTSTLYAYFNNDDTSLTDGRIKSYTGSAWSPADSFSDDGKLIDIGNDTFALVVRGSTDPTLYITNDLTTPPAVTDAGNVVDTVSIVGGTNLGSTTHYLISDSTVYSWDSSSPNTLADLSLSNPEKTGNFAAITSNGIDTLYLVTTSGQVFSSDGTSLVYITTVGGSVEAEYGAASVVDISGPKLMIGTDDGYYLMELNGTIIESPDDYAASYPELAAALVHQVYQKTATDDIYLATENGLWKRTATGEFERQ